ncbi:CRISPR system precrRNA processing endoribonuclease RAMP protein Cas6 [Micropruina sp.]|uniref:CRISPR system precrRNA processing endoribonuclease RAMP protein Cas6 n=1 Tax=Micropruina sp. TaxID=2737536 RepID=UPI0039E45FFA
MPTRWWIPLEGVRPERVKLEHIHAAASRWFDRTPEQHAAGSKPYSISPLAKDTAGGVGFELSTLTDEAGGLLRTAVVPPATLRLGIDQAIVGRPSRLVAESWESLAQPSGSGRWELEFVTPVTFRHGRRSSPLPVAASVLRGLVDTWNSHSGLPHRELTRRDTDEVWVSDIEGRSELMMVSGIRLSAFSGRVCYRCDDQWVAGLVDALFRLAPYAGVGSAKAKGLGVTRLRPVRRARAAG